jgi:hypothetical protein
MGGKRKPLNESDFLDMLEIAMTDFDDRLEPIMPTTVVHLQHLDAIGNAWHLFRATYLCS